MAGFKISSQDPYKLEPSYLYSLFRSNFSRTNFSDEFNHEILVSDNTKSSPNYDSSLYEQLNRTPRYNSVTIDDICGEELKDAEGVEREEIKPIDYILNISIIDSKTLSAYHEDLVNFYYEHETFDMTLNSFENDLFMKCLSDALPKNLFGLDYMKKLIYFQRDLIGVDGNIFCTFYDDGVRNEEKKYAPEGFYADMQELGEWFLPNGGWKFHHNVKDDIFLPGLEFFFHLFERNFNPKVYLICRPTGTGKSTLMDGLSKTPYIVQAQKHGTRDVRNIEPKYTPFTHREIESEIRLQKMIPAGNLSGNQYGYSIEQINAELNLDNDVLLDLASSPDSIREMKKFFGDKLRVIYLTSSPEKIIENLCMRDLGITKDSPNYFQNKKRRYEQLFQLKPMYDKMKKHADVIIASDFFSERTEKVREYIMYNRRNNTSSNPNSILR